MFEILIPLVLIIVLLMCMMNNNTEEAFSVGGSSCGKLPVDSFNVGGQSDIPRPKANANANANANARPNAGQKQCKITMVWADWCGFSKKAKPEWDKLVAKHHNKVIDGCKVTFEDAEEKVSPDIVKKFKTTGFPTYYCEMDGKVEEFNSIKEDDMLNKVKQSIAKMKGSGNAPSQPQPQPQPKPQPQPQPQPQEKQRFNTRYDKIRPTVEGEILFSSCEDSEYGPIRLDSVVRNLAGVGNAPNNVLGYGDCTELEFAPVKFSTGGPQIPSMNSLMPSGAQLKAPGIDGIQGIIRPSSFGSPVRANSAGNARANSAGNARANGIGNARANGIGNARANGIGNARANGNAGGKKARVTMVRADWCGFCKKAMPEWEKLKSEIHNKVVNGHHMELRDLEQKRDEAEIKKNYSDVNGFPTYVVETTDSSGKLTKVGSFNSIEKNDMHEKIKKNLN